MGFEGHRAVDERLEHGKQPVIARWLGIAEQERKDQAGLDELRQRVAQRRLISSSDHGCADAPQCLGRIADQLAHGVVAPLAAGECGIARARMRASSACSGDASLTASAIVYAIAKEVKS